MVLLLFDLPPELIIRILSFLEPRDLVACQLTGTALRDIIVGSVLLQYANALTASGMEGNPNSKLSIAERLAKLKAREEAWKHLQPEFTSTISIQHNPSGIYDLTGGVYLLGNYSRRALHFCNLPSAPSGETTWNRIDVNRSIIDMGLAVYEHDLIAVITTQRKVTGSEESIAHEIELQLLEFSTGKQHPLAHQPLLHVDTGLWGRPAIGIEIVGKHLVLVLSHYNNVWRPQNQVYVYDWKRGVLKMRISRSYHSYSGLICLTEDVFLLPNANDGTLEFWEIPETLDKAPSDPACTLALPQLAPGRTLGSISCRGEPNPMGKGSTSNARKPFSPSAEESIIIFNVRVQPALLAAAMNIHFGNTFTFFVHRRALLDIYSARLPKKAAEQEAIKQKGKEEEAFEEEIKQKGEGEGEGEGEEVAQEELQQEPGDELDQEEHILDEIDQEEADEDEFEHKDECSSSAVPWSQWGPPITRWLNSDSVPTRWITTTSGQRCVLISDNAPQTGFPFVVLDFNPYNVKRIEKELKDGPTSRMWCVTHEEQLEHSGSFEEDLVSCLPYVACASVETFGFDGVLMDEERILGIDTDMQDRIRSVKVYYFG